MTNVRFHKNGQTSWTMETNYGEGRLEREHWLLYQDGTYVNNGSPYVPIPGQVLLKEQFRNNETVDDSRFINTNRLYIEEECLSDMEFVKTMVKDHEKAVSLFQKQSESGKDADVKAWAAKTLPTLQGHLEMAKSLNDKLKAMKTPKKNSDSDKNTNSMR